MDISVAFSSVVRIKSTLRTSRIVASSKENAASGFPFANDMTSSRSAQNAILADQQLLDAVSSPNLCNQLYDFWVVVSTIATDYKESAFSTFWN
jgi:hypothetical protein